jgi:hypothetical protein
MQTYTAIAVLSLLGITLSANAAQAFETQLPSLETPTAEHMLSTQTQQWRSRPPSRPPNRGDGRRNFTQPNVDIHPLQNF